GHVCAAREGREFAAEKLPQPSRNGASDKAPKNAKRAPARGGRPGRVVDPPSWQKAGRRALLFAPFMFGILYFLNRDLPLFGVVLNTLILVAFFLPFGYLMDR